MAEFGTVVEDEATPVEFGTVIDEPVSSVVEFGTVVEDEATPVEFGTVVEDEPTTGEIVKGVGAEMGASVAGSVAGGIIGGTIGSAVPVLGTAVGTTVGIAIGGFIGGFLGSLWAQDIEGQEDVSVGRALGAAVVSAIPLGGATVKGAAGATKIGLSTVGRAAGREAVKGAALGTTEATIRTVVDEGRMPTKEELATYSGGGALFGSAIGAVTPKVSKSLDKFLGKSFQKIDEEVASGKIGLEDVKNVSGVADADGEKILASSVDNIKGRVKSQVAVESVDVSTENPSNLVRMKDRFLSILAPSKVVGKEARNEALSFRKRVAAAEELGGRVERRVSSAIKKDPLVEGKVNAFLKGGDLDSSLGDLRDDLVVYRDKLDELEGELIHQLELDHMASLESGELQKVTDKILDLKQKSESLSGKKRLKSQQKIQKLENKLEATPRLIEKIKKSRELGDYTRREYKMFTDSSFVPDLKLREKARDELVTNMLAKNKNMSREVAEQRADDHLTKLEGRSARAKKLDTGRAGRAKDEAPLMRKKNVGPAERAWLGEITETGERMRGTLSGVARLVARKQTDRNVANILAKNGLAVPSNKELPGMVPLKLKAGETTGLYVPTEV